METIPIEFAVALTILMLVAGAYAWATGFHQKWRRTLHWARNQRLQPSGPILSRWSHGAGAALCLVVPFAFFGPSFGIRGWACELLSILAGAFSAAMIGGMICDFIRAKLR